MSLGGRRELFPDDVFVVAPIDQLVHLAVIVPRKQQSTLDAFAEEEVRGFRKQQLLRSPIRGDRQVRGDMLRHMNVTRPIRFGGVGALAGIAVLAVLAPLGLEAAAPGATAAEPTRSTPYAIQPGDILTVSVWNEKELQTDVLVRPDGGLSFPLAGDIQASGHTVDDVRQLIEKGLKRYIPDPAVSVAVKQIGGNFIYVIGKVNRPGQFSFSKPLDVMQALALAGGATPYAAVDEIRILQRDAAGIRAIAFHYNDIEKGRNLEQDILLRSGDTVVVP